MGFKDFLAELQIEMNMYEGKNSDPKTVVSGRVVTNMVPFFVHFL